MKQFPTIVRSMMKWNVTSVAGRSLCLASFVPVFHSFHQGNVWNEFSAIMKGKIRLSFLRDYAFQKILGAFSLRMFSHTLSRGYPKCWNSKKLHCTNYHSIFINILKNIWLCLYSYLQEHIIKLLSTLYTIKHHHSNAVNFQLIDQLSEFVTIFKIMEQVP